jgi:tRNA A-37 threonylcarbamoyl transferase component Bud32
MPIEQFILDDISRNDTFCWKVDLSNCGLTDDDLLRLAHALEGNTIVQVLNLRGNEVTARGLSELLAAATNVPTLRELDVSRNPHLGDAAVRCIEGLLLASSTIGFIGISECGLTARGREAIIEAAERYVGKVGMIELALEPEADESDAGSDGGGGGGGGGGDGGSSSNLPTPKPVSRGSSAQDITSSLGGAGGGPSVPGSSRDPASRLRTSRLPSPAVRGFSQAKSLRSTNSNQALLSRRVGSTNVSLADSVMDDDDDDDDDDPIKKLNTAPAPIGQEKFVPYTRIKAEDLQVGSKIASGGFARVYRGTWQGQDVAIKIFKKGKEEATKVAFEKEIHVLAALRHPNIVKMLGAYTDNDGRLAIVTELMRGGSLFDLLQKHNKAGTKLPIPQLTLILRDIAEGCAYLHGTRPPIIHRDLKSLNVLLTDHERAKVADFGLSREFVDGETMTVGIGTVCGSFFFFFFYLFFFLSFIFFREKEKFF